MRVLLSAYSCNPKRGSEDAAGWRTATALATRHDVTVLTRKNNREDIESAPLPPMNGSLVFEYLDATNVVLQTKKHLPLGVYGYYMYWQRLARLRGTQLHRGTPFDVVHHVTFASDWLPASTLAVPAPMRVWGPVGGLTGPAPVLWRYLGPRGACRELLRLVATSTLRSTVGCAALRRADVAIAQNSDVAAGFRKRGRSAEVLPNVAIEVPPLPADATEPRPPDRRPTAIFAGRLLPHKGIKLALLTLAEPAAAAWSLRVYGSGPELGRAQALCSRLGLDDRVTWRGHVPREALLLEMTRTDALLAPSLYDGSGFAVAEAAALGCPVVAIDQGGPSVILGDGHIKVPPSRHAVRDLALGLNRVLLSRPSPDPRWSYATYTERLLALLEQAASRVDD